jgi:hypothetical protein
VEQNGITGNVITDIRKHYLFYVLTTKNLVLHWSNCCY